MPTTTTPDKVQFNLYNVHYAVLTESVGTGGTVTYSYGTPVAVPGAVTLTADASGETNVFYADGIAYYTSSANNGYEGDLEVARVPESMLLDVFGMTQGATSKVITEMANVEIKPIALLFKIDGDKTGADYVFYNVKLGRPGVGSSTNTNTKTPNTYTMSLSATPRGDFKIKAHTTADTPTATRSGWYSSVHEETASTSG